MIFVAKSGTNFRSLVAYVMREEQGAKQTAVAWTASRNLPSDDPSLAASVMAATAAPNTRVDKPTYHIALSFAPDDPVDRAVMERVADRVLEKLRLAEHQALLVAHQDRPHPHVHIIVNKVHPQTGRAWYLWHDWQHIREVLSHEERALGLRQVDRPRTAVDDVARDLRTYERVTALTEERYRAQLAASAATARTAQLEFAGERARTTLDRSSQAFAAVYHDPQEAYRAYLAAVDEYDVSRATQLMFERPEQFGGLVTVERGRAFGLLQVADESGARAAAPVAAAAAREALDAAGSWRSAAESVARALEQAFERELATIFEDPQAARATFQRHATELGAERAAAALRDRPQTFGPLLPSAGQDLRALGEQAARAAARGGEGAQARGAAQGAIAPPHGDVILALSRSELDRATGRERALRAELAALAEQGELGRRLGFALARLSPRELGFLRTAVTAPQFAIVAQLGRRMRDIALGRDEERDQSP